MANGFTKLHSGILASTIWRESPAVKVVWITLLAMADQHGIVEATVPGLAAFANVSVEETEASLDKFLSPDKYSRTPDCEGRRIEVIDGGWQLLNYQKYREKLSEEDRKRQAVGRQQKYRDRLARDAKRNASVTGRDDDDLLCPSRQAEADAEALNTKTLVHSPNEPAEDLLLEETQAREPEAPTQSGKRAKAARTLMAAELYTKYPRRQGKAEGIKAIEKAIIAVAKRDFGGDEKAATDWLGNKLNEYARSAQGSRPEKNLIPLPATFFNQGRYDDDPETWKYAGTGNGFGGRQQTPIVAQRPPDEQLNAQVARYRAQHPVQEVRQ